MNFARLFVDYLVINMLCIVNSKIMLSEPLYFITAKKFGKITWFSDLTSCCLTYVHVQQHCQWNRNVIGSLFN